MSESIDYRKEILITKNSFAKLNMLIKDWSLLKNEQVIVDERLERIYEIEHQVDNTFLFLQEIIYDSKELPQLFDIKINWLNLKNNSVNIEFSFIENINQEIQNIIDIKENKYIQNELMISRHTNRLYLLIFSVFLITSVLFLIFFYIRNQQAKSSSELIVALEKLRFEASSASDLKSKFLSTVSHEIRTPLNGIIGLTDVLMQTLPNEGDKVFVKTIHQSGKSLLQIINDILDISKIESGRFELENLKFSITEMFEQIYFTLSSRAAEKSIYLNYQIDPDMPLYVEADSGRLTQVLFNIVGNAIKFTDIGGVIFRAEVERKEGKKIVVRFCVVDSGSGIAEEDLKNLFIPFAQGKKSKGTSEGGTGLGLSISQQIVKQMGSVIHVSSEVNRGTKFWFDIVFEEYSKEKVGKFNKSKVVERVKFKRKVEPLIYKPTNMKVLVVEDNPTSQIVAQAMLSELGIQSLIASDGREAVAMALKTNFDIILMDCQMPNMDGFESTIKLRQEGITVPIIAMTANASKEEEVRCKEVGMNAFLLKPILIDNLRNILKGFLSCSKRTYSNPMLRDLEEKIGKKAVTKVVKSFIGSLPDFNSTFISCIKNKDLDGIKKLAHKFKSSALAVGANEFSDLCKRLENLDDLVQIKKIRDEVVETVILLEVTFSAYSS